MFLKNLLAAAIQAENDGEGSDLGGGEVSAEAFEALADDFDTDDVDAPTDTDASADETNEKIVEEEAPAADAPQSLEEEPESKSPAEEESQTPADDEKPKEGEEEKPAEEEKPQEEEKPREEEPEPELVSTPEEQLTKYNTDRKASLDSIEKLYAFTSEEDIELLRTEPEKMIPKLAAEMFYDIHESVVRSVYNMLPQFMEQMKTQQVAQQEQQDAFAEAWPVLKDAKYQADIKRIQAMYTQINPQASQEQAIREVGAQVLIANKIPFNTQTGQIISEEVVQDQAAPHTPARPTAAAPTPAKPAGNDFEEFSKEFNDD